MRGRMVDRASYVPPFQLGEPLQGGAIGKVAASNDPRLKRGDLVSTMFGWRELFNAPAANLQKLDTFGLPPQAFGGCRHARPDGMGGPVKVAALKPGDVVFVSAAAGDVEGNRRAWHRECAHSLSQVVQGREFGKMLVKLV